VETATVVFTDLVGSTALRTRLGEDAADELRSEHDALVRTTAAAHGGREVKHTGDGFMLAFGSAAAAVEAAVHLQQASQTLGRRSDAAVAVRVGISAGDVQRDGDDLFGLPVVQAARLCDVASGGQILVAEVARTLAGARGDLAFEPLGERELKGLDHPVVVHEATWEPAPSATPLPAALDPGRSLPLVGRDTELGRLRDLWKAATVGNRRVVLVAGEPGVGKTRLVQELGRAVHADGAMVLLGRCDDAVPAPLRPVTELVDHALAHGPPAALADLTEEQRAVLDRLAHRRVATAGTDLDPALETIERHEAVDALLTALAADAPVLVVFDDLHWADRASVLLLRHLALERSTAPVLVVGTYRDTDLDRTHPLAEVLADLRRTAATERVLLRGLDAAGTGELVALWAGGSAPQPFVQAIFDETEGNPFFVGEVLLHLAETGAIYQDPAGQWTTDHTIAQLGIPEGVRETVGRRLAQLDETTNHVLSTASVAGRQFDLDVVADAAELTEAEALDALEPALQRSLLVEGDRFGRFEFAHALVRSTLLDELTNLRQVRLHQKIGASIERRRGDRLDHHADELAHHFTEAAVAGEWERAVRYQVMAAERAEQLGDAAGFEQHLLRALELHHDSAVDDPDTELDLTVRLSLHLGGATDVNRARSFVDRALAVARRTGDTDHIARALWSAVNLAEYGAENVDLLVPVEDLLAVIPDQDSTARALGLALRAFLLGVSTSSRAPQAEALATAEAAVAMAERLGSPEVQGPALVALGSCLYSSPRPERELEVIRSFEKLPGPFPSLRFTTMASMRRLGPLMQLGRRDEYDHVLAEVRAGPAMGSPLVAAGNEQRSAALALADGRLDDALTHAAASLEQRPDSPNVALSFYAQRWVARHEQDRIDPDRLAELASSMPTPWMEALAGLVRAERGDLDGAATALDAFAGRADLGIPFDSGQAPTLAVLSETAAHVGDAAFAAALTPYVVPYQGQLFSAFLGNFCAGAADRALGQSALAQGDPDAAVAHLEAGLALEEGFRADALVARSRYWLARALLARGAPGDTERADHELRTATEIAERRGLLGIQRLVERLRSSG
jgi:class 3 adenylate cyclase/tetratricopeptide (TPR) repeat protein